MLSYQHAFHAGNFADVLKHTVLVQILDYLKLKNKPLFYLDTHAGIGLYHLNSKEAAKNREYVSGIGKLWRLNDSPETIRPYLELIKSLNPQGSLLHYPGSPVIAQKLLRRTDRLFVFELHPNQYQLLNSQLKPDKRIKIELGDGLNEGLNLLPPIQHRGLVLIDPSYEVKTDYKAVVSVLAAMYKRFANGIFALWYPVVERGYIQALELAIQKSAIKNVQLFELGVEPDSPSLGMTACGMIVVNPPWLLSDRMANCLPWLVKVLGQDGQGFFRVVQLVKE